MKEAIVYNFLESSCPVNLVVNLGSFNVPIEQTDPRIDFGDNKRYIISNDH